MRRALSCGLTLAVLLLVSAMVASAAPKHSGPPLEGQIRQLRQQLAVERAVREAQNSDSSDYFNAVTIIVGVATLLIAVVAIAATAVGYRLVRDYVEKEFDRRIATAFDEKVTPQISSRFDQALGKFDEQFAALVEQLRRGTAG